MSDKYFIFINKSFYKNLFQKDFTGFDEAQLIDHLVNFVYKVHFYNPNRLKFKLSFDLY